MMNHKLCFQLYGVRRPLKWRRRMARRNKRAGGKLTRYKNHIFGHHTRWWFCGQEMLMEKR